MTLNMDNIDEKRVYNLTQLRKNSRKRPNKKAGQKASRPCDEDQLSVINPAPDSVKKYSIISSTPILTPQSILKKRKATSPVHVTAKKKIRFEDNSSDNVIIEKSSVNDFKFTAIPQSPDPAAVPSLHAASPPRISLSPHISPSAPSTSSPGSLQSPARNSPIHSGRVWQQFQEHAFTFKEKTDVKFDRKLCSETMNYCQCILQTQFPNINGFQYTSKVPVYKNNQWKYHVKMNSQSSPCVQIHHTGRDHWITSCQDTSGTIYVLDSMNSKSFTTSVQIQMSTGADPGFQVRGRT